MTLLFLFFFFNDTATTEIYTLSLHDALPICARVLHLRPPPRPLPGGGGAVRDTHHGDAGAVGRSEGADCRSEEHTSELQSRLHLVCRLLLEKKKKKNIPLNQPKIASAA